MPTIKGKWKFNNYLDASERYYFDATVNFTSNNQNFMLMDVSFNRDEEFLSYGNIEVYDGNEGGWHNDAWKYVDFGSTDQTVSQEFYNWFLENADEEVTTKSIDLNEHDWGEKTGTTIIRVQAHDSSGEYGDSDDSNPVSFEIAASTEYYILSTREQASDEYSTDGTTWITIPFHRLSSAAPADFETYGNLVKGNKIYIRAGSGYHDVSSFDFYDSNFNILPGGGSKSPIQEGEILTYDVPNGAVYFNVCFYD